MLNILPQVHAKEIVFLGDFFDVYSLSRYRKNPRKAYQLFDLEVKPCIELMHQIVATSKCKRVTFLEGNHERRILTYIQDKCPAFINYLKPTDILGIDPSWRYVPYGQGGFHRIGDLLITHGTLTSKHVCFNMIQKYHSNVLFGHTHRVQVYTTRTWDGQVLRAYNIGWLGDFKRAGDYIDDVPDWCHAFAIGWFYRGGHTIQIVNIDKGKAVFNGEIHSQKTPHRG
jgi:hypothetical protein